MTDIVKSLAPLVSHKFCESGKSEKMPEKIRFLFFCTEIWHLLKSAFVKNCTEIRHFLQLFIIMWSIMLKWEINRSCDSFVFLIQGVFEKAYNPHQRFLDPLNRFLRLRFRFGSALRLRSGSALHLRSTYASEKIQGIKKSWWGSTLFRDPPD